MSHLQTYFWHHVKWQVVKIRADSRENVLFLVLNIVTYNEYQFDI